MDNLMNEIKSLKNDMNKLQIRITKAERLQKEKLKKYISSENSSELSQEIQYLENTTLRYKGYYNYFEELKHETEEGIIQPHEGDVYIIKRGGSMDSSMSILPTMAMVKYDPLINGWNKLDTKDMEIILIPAINKEE